MTKPPTFKNIVRQKKRGRGRPVTVEAERYIGIRLPDRQLDNIDAWASAHDVSRSEAIRRLVDRGLAAKVADQRKSRK